MKSFPKLSVSIVLIISLYAMVGCREQNVKVCDNVTFEEDIAGINSKYVQFTSPSYRSPNRAKNSDEGIGTIAAADAVGALNSAYDAFNRTKNPGLSIGIGIIGGATASLVAYKLQKADTTSGEPGQEPQNKLMYAVDMANPIYSKTISKDPKWFNSYFDSNVGIYHNYLVKYALIESDEGLLDKEIDNKEIFARFAKVLISEGVCNERDLQEGYSSFEVGMSYKYYDNEFLYSLPDRKSSKYLVDYISIAESLPKDKCFDYTTEYLGALTDALRSTEEIEEILPIEVGVEVWYYSHLLWNYFIPRPNQVSAFLFQVSSDVWVLTDSYEKMYSLVNDGNAIAIGVPKIIDNRLTEVFFFKDIEKYGTFIPDGKYIYDSENMQIGTIETDMNIKNILSIYGVYDVKNIYKDGSVRYVSFKEK